MLVGCCPFLFRFTNGRFEGTRHRGGLRGWKIRQIYGQAVPDLRSPEWGGHKKSPHSHECGLFNLWRLLLGGNQDVIGGLVVLDVHMESVMDEAQGNDCAAAINVRSLLQTQLLGIHGGVRISDLEPK